MFLYKVPKLEPGPLKKEILWCMRDLPLEELSIRYHDYTNGIVSGCSLFEENMKIGVNPGIVKYSGRLYFLSERTSVEYSPTDSWTVLKIKFSPQRQHPEYHWFEGHLALDTSTNILPNELEVGRFKLKVGSRLRTEYQDFEDMGTEYDTVNLTDIQWAMPYNSALHPTLLLHFAREVLSYTADKPIDFAFCNTIIASNGVVTRESVERYLCLSKAAPYRPLANQEVFDELAGIASKLAGNKPREEELQEGIFVF